MSLQPTQVRPRTPRAGFPPSNPRPAYLENLPDGRTQIRYVDEGLAERPDFPNRPVEQLTGNGFILAMRVISPVFGGVVHCAAWLKRLIR